MALVKLLHAARNPLEAHLVAEFLKENGVPAFVENECLWGVRGEMAMDLGSAPRVLVRDEDHAKAAALLAERWAGGASDR